VLVLDERHQVHVVLAEDDEDALADVTVGVRVLQDVEQVPRSIWKTTSSNPMPRSALSFWLITRSLDVLTRTATAKFLMVPPRIEMSVRPMTSIPAPVPEPLIV
jgi:hypothetical protein